MKIFQEAGLPDGVINYIPGPAETITGNEYIQRYNSSDLLFNDEHFAGIHYTGEKKKKG